MRRLLTCSILLALSASEAFAAGKPITWTVTLHDNVVNVAGFGDVVETQTIRRTALHTDANAVTIVTKVRTDGAGRVIESVDAENQVTSVTYDAGGNRLSVRDPNGVGQDCTYDARNRDISCTDTQGDTTQTGYNTANQVISKTDAKGNTETCEFDPHGRRISCTNRIGAITSWRYDENNNLARLVDSELQQTDYTYDSRNLQVQTTWPDHTAGSTPGQAGYGITTCAYDPAGRRTVCTDQLGDTKTQVYDMANRVLLRDYSSPLALDPDAGKSDVFTYDAASRMLTATSNRYNNIVTNVYDNAGRMISESLTVNFGAPQTYTTTCAHDAANRKTQITYPDGIAVDRAYTDRDQLKEIKYNGTVVDTRTYDPGRRMLTSTLGNGIVNTHAYRNDNLTSGITRTGLADTDFTYTYDANKNKETETISGVMANYGFSTGATGYDDEDRLMAWNRTDGNKDQAWTLTTEGDWQAFNETGTTAKTETRTYTAAHELASINGTALTHDVKGNITANSNGQTHAWDFDNRLKRVTYGVDAAVEYTYDALGRRVSKALGTITSISDPTVFVCTSQPLEHSPHAGQVLAEYTATSATTNPDRKYVYATYIDDPVVMVDRTSRGSTAAGTDELFYYHRNNLYSVAALTNALAGVVERYAYDAYGNIAYLAATGALAASQASTVANPYTYTGRRLDDETGLYYYRARYYDSKLGRFIGRDPIGYAGSRWSLYEYVDSRLLTQVDPNGLEVLSPEPVNKWPSDDKFEDGSESCLCRSLRGDRMRPTSPITGQSPPVPGLPFAVCHVGEVAMVRYQSSCAKNPDKPEACCEEPKCFEYVCYKCKIRKGKKPFTLLPHIKTTWQKCDASDPRRSTRKSKCS